MGFISDVFGKGDSAEVGVRAARIEQQSNQQAIQAGTFASQQAIAELRRQFDLTQEQVTSLFGATQEQINRQSDLTQGQVAGLFGSTQEQITSQLGATQEQIASQFGITQEELNRLLGATQEQITGQFGITQEQINSLFGATQEQINRQLGATQEQITPFIEAGQRQIPGLEAGATPGGLDATLAQLFDTDIFGSLVEERGRAVQGQLAAGGLTRTGTALTEAARVPTEIGLALESLLTGRSQALATGGLGAGINLGQLGAQASSTLAQLSTGAAATQAGLSAAQSAALAQLSTGAAATQAGLSAAQSAALAGLGTGTSATLAGLSTGAAANLAGLGAGTSGGIANLLSQAGFNTASLLSQSGQAGSAGILTDARTSATGSQNIFNAAAAIGSSELFQTVIKAAFFSDPNLKENIEQVGQIGPLPLMQWDWIPEAKTIKLITKGMSLGFLTTDVIKHFPQHVYHYCGFDCIDYHSLLDELEAK